MQRHSPTGSEISIKNWKAVLILCIVFLILLNLFFIFHKEPKSEMKILPQQEKEALKVSEFKIIKQEGIRANNTIKGVIKNINGTISDVTITARLLYARKPVAEKNISLYDIKLYEERNFEIKFEKNLTWNAFELKII